MKLLNPHLGFNVVMNKKEEAKISKFLSLVLRHKPDIIDIELDENGWVNVDELIEKLKRKGKNINVEELELVVKNNNKQRFSFSSDKTKIRANQGHSLNIDLGYVSQTPPQKLYHGTATKYIDSIIKTGLIKKSRHHVHLSHDKETALKVGARHGKVVLFEVNAANMFKDGFEFYKSKNEVWLTDNVPPQYLIKVL